MLGRRRFVDESAQTTIAWIRNSMETARALARKVLWARDFKPSEVDASAVYVFDAALDDETLSQMRAWIAGLPAGRPPLTVVVAPKANESLTNAEYNRFESSIADLWVYPLSRPVHDSELLAHVSSLLTLQVPPATPISVREVPIASAADVFPLPEIDFAERFD
jgi:hypothetical protein